MATHAALTAMRENYSMLNSILYDTDENITI